MVLWLLWNIVLMLLYKTPPATATSKVQASSLFRTIQVDTV